MKKKHWLLLNKLRQTVEDYEMPNGIKVTVSIDITALKQNDALEEVVSRADHALYAAKRQGRNRSVLFTEQ